MSRVLNCLWSVLMVASCVTDVPTLTTTESELTTQQLHDQSIIIFSHDHVRDTLPSGRAQHFDDALAGGVTAMTIELVVDNLKFMQGAVEVFGPANSGAN